jgi:hypothetical protein
MTIIHDAPNHLEKIDAVWMVVSVDENGNEGMVAAPIGPDRVTMPLIAADEARLKSIIPMAEHMAKLFPWKKMRLIKLTTREEVMEIGST